MKKIDESTFLGYLSTIYYEIKRVNNNISVLTMLHDSMEEFEDSMFTELNVINAARCGLLDTLGELEKVHAHMLSHIEGSKK